MPRALPLVLGAVGVAGALGVAAYASDQPADRTAADTRIGGMPAGGLDRAGLERLLRDTVERTPDALTVRLGTKTVPLPVDDLGVELDVSATAQRALAASGHRFWQRTGDPRTVEPVLTTDEGELDDAVDQLVVAAETKERHGALRVRDRRFEATPPTDGQHVEPGTVRDALLDAVEGLPWATELTVPAVSDPAHVTLAQVQEVVQRANTLLEPPLRLRAGENGVTLSAAQLAAVLELAELPQPVGHGVVLALRPGPSRALAQELAEDLTTEALEPKVDAPSPAALLKEKGSATWRPVPAVTRVSEGGKAGQEVTPEAVLEVLRGLVTGTTQPAARVPVPTRSLPPKTSDADAARINSVLGTFTTPFACCQSRVRNITLMARALDGLVVARGESLSINDTIGPRTREKGYVEAPYIFEGELSTDIGGGVSQVGTTMLNAAFFGGLQLDEHKAHSFYISRYPAGREATLNYPTIDVRWTNTSNGPVLVRTRVTSTSITVTLYGVDDGRVVTGTSGPRQEVPGRDFRITITRTVTRPGHESETTRFTTTYNKPPEDH